MRIFIGCSSSHLYGLTSYGKQHEITESNKQDLIENEDSLANYLYKNLKDSGFKVEAWWRKETFPDGVDFFRKIHELSHHCDTGVFILNNEAKLEHESESDKYYTNSNVLLELGMFISQKGLGNVVFISDSKVTMPSDFSAINVIKRDFSELDSEKRNEILAEILSRINNIGRDFPTDYINASIYFNYDTTDIILNRHDRTQSWNSKSAYIGYEAAKLWRDIELDPDYLPAQFKYDFRNYLRNIESELENVRNIISLGSGIGTLDEEVLRLIPYEGSIKYIPVDINPYLAIQALHRGVRSIINLHSTYAIIDDFEEQTSQLHDFIKNRIVKTEEISLYTILGGTFCNLDNQHSFLVSWSKIVDSNDLMLIDAYIKNDFKQIHNDWTDELKKKLKEGLFNDLEYNKEADFKNRIKNEYVKPMIDNAISHKFQTSSHFRENKKVKEYLNLDWSDKKKNMYNNNDNDGYVDIEIKETENESVVFIYRFKTDDDKKFKDNNVTTLFKAKRHNLFKLYNKIKDHFDVIDVNCIKINNEVSRAYFLCKQKENENEVE